MNYFVLMMKMGEIVITGVERITKVEEVSGCDSLSVSYPALIGPIPNAPDKLGFSKYFPFSDSKDKMEIMVKNIVTVSKPNEGILKLYLGWIDGVRKAESNIITPDSGGRRIVTP